MTEMSIPQTDFICDSDAAPYVREVEQSWVMFLQRTGRLRHQATVAYGSAVERVGRAHASALQLSKRLVASTPYLRDLFPSDSDREMLLIYFYLLAGVALLHLITSFIRNVLYA